MIEDFADATEASASMGQRENPINFRGESSLVPVFAGYLARVGDQVGVIAVHVEYGSIYNASYVGAVLAGPGVPRVGSETNLRFAEVT